MKITSMRPIGVRKTYSPEMRSAQHNYMTAHSLAVHKNSHSVAYCLVAYRCLWLKAHFAPEWWAAVMTHCHQEKLQRYMNVARADDVKFETFDVNNLTVEFTVHNGVVHPGLISLKKVGDSIAKRYVNSEAFNDIDAFVTKYGKDKILFERLIKLGAFKKLHGHENAKALWLWYQYAYTSDPQLKKDINARLLALDWTPKSIQDERDRQISEYKKLYPKRNKIPPKILKWAPKPEVTREKVMGLCTDDFSEAEILKFENEYLGYYIHSPLNVYKRCGFDIKTAKNTYRKANAEIRKGGVILEAIITEAVTMTTKAGSAMMKLTISDGHTESTLFVWEQTLNLMSKEMKEETFKKDVAFVTRVQYDPGRDSFTLARDAMLQPLKLKEEDAITR